MTITVRLPDELEAKLRNRLDKEQVALSEYVRMAITEKLEREPEPAKPSAYEIWQQCFDGWSSGESDRAERIEDILKEKFDAKRRSRQ